MESKILDDLYKEWYGESHLVNSNKAVHDSSEAMDFANHCMDKQQSKIDKLEKANKVLNNKLRVACCYCQNRSGAEMGKARTGICINCVDYSDFNRDKLS